MMKLSLYSLYRGIFIIIVVIIVISIVSYRGLADGTRQLDGAVAIRIIIIIIIIIIILYYYSIIVLYNIEAWLTAPDSLMVRWQ